MSLKYEPASKPLHIFVKQLFYCKATTSAHADKEEEEGLKEVRADGSLRVRVDGSVNRVGGSVGPWV